MVRADAAVQEFGDIVFQFRGDVLWIVSADPRILISAEMMEQAHGWADPDAVGRAVHPNLVIHCEPATCPTGDVWTIDVANRRVVYRIGRYLHDKLAYEAEWPD